jgi:hypothetical protein
VFDAHCLAHHVATRTRCNDDLHTLNTIPYADRGVHFRRHLPSGLATRSTSCTPNMLRNIYLDSRSSLSSESSLLLVQVTFRDPDLSAHAYSQRFQKMTTCYVDSHTLASPFYRLPTGTPVHQLSGIPDSITDYRGAVCKQSFTDLMQRMVPPNITLFGDWRYYADPLGVHTSFPYQVG